MQKDNTAIVLEEENTLSTSTKFTDTKVRTWDCKMDLGAAEAIDDSDFTAISETKFSILEPSKDFFLSLLQETRLTFAIVWAIVRSQAADNGLLDQVLDTHKKLYEDEDTEEEVEIPKLAKEELESLLQEAFVRSLDGAVIFKGREALWAALSDFFPDMKNVLSIIRQNHQKLMKEMEVTILEAAPRIEKMVKKALKERVDEALTDLEKDISPSTQSEEKHGDVSTQS